MKTIAIYPAEILSTTLASGKAKFAKDIEKSRDKRLPGDTKLTPGRIEARRMRRGANVPPGIPAAARPVTGIASSARTGFFVPGAGCSDIRTALARTPMLTGALERESALWGARSLWGESALWGGPAATGNIALCGESALWGRALCGESSRRPRPVV